MESHLSSLLLLMIFLPDSLYGHSEVQELQKPVISVHAPEDKNVAVACQMNLKTPAVNTSCYLYVGDSSQPYRSTWTTNGRVCSFNVERADLQQHLQALRTGEVSCDYAVNTNPHSHSPRSDREQVPGKLPKAELGLSRAVISIEESMTLRCRGPDSSPVSHCTFTINERAISGSDCERSVTGADLLSGRPSALNELSMRCFYSLEGRPSLPSDPSTVTVLGRLPKAKLGLSHAAISIEESMTLRCRGPDSPPVSRCTFTINERPISGSDCERSVTPADLLSGRHSALNELTMRCFYSLEGRPSPFSDSSTVTVLALKKPSISVSMKNNQAHIHCEAPSDITGAEFFLYLCSTLSKTLVNSTVAGKEERAAIFTVPHSSDSTLIYYCIYQLKRINSELSDCAEVKNKDQRGGTEDQKWLKTGAIIIVVGILMGMTGVSLYWIHSAYFR
ncbi:uncharacterized protein LOC133124307 isoform X2 [Conger conger]|uniref:uncharacterized protein LOC133124307 isoform X2 n=1 Tax=Conger conger TaxID=82655 RepID=UPI002A599DFE|nr:uncharacterized protein LOC133124307 isoform X2 [Conger conger]